MSRHKSTFKQNFIAFLFRSTHVLDFCRGTWPYHTLSYHSTITCPTASGQTFHFPETFFVMGLKNTLRSQPMLASKLCYFVHYGFGVFFPLQDYQAYCYYPPHQTVKHLLYFLNKTNGDSSVSLAIIRIQAKLASKADGGRH